MTRGLMRSKVLWIVPAAVTILIIAGCSRDLPLAPETDQTPNLARLGNLTFRLNEMDIPMELPEVSAPIIAARGGEIDIPRESYVHSFDVPRGGLSENTVITVSTYAEPVAGQNAIVFEFGPDGIVFRRACLLTIDMAEINPSAASASLYYYDPAVRDWVIQSTVQVENGVAVFQIYHFSRYAIAD